jgi:hypothetical protein
MLFVGCGDGSVAVPTAGSGALGYALAAATSAVRSLHASASLLLAGYDDGSAVLFSCRAEPL